MTNFKTFRFWPKDDLLTGYYRSLNAKNSEYGDVSATGLSYPGIHHLPFAPVYDSITLRQNLGTIESIDTFYRLTTPSMNLPTYIHNDTAMADVTGILYLNREGRGGTALWKHKESGLISTPTQTDLDRLGHDYMTKLTEDGINESAWEMRELAEMEFGKFVAFDSNLWHSCYPRGGWGTTPEDGRLIQVFFMKGLSWNHKNEL